MSDNTVRTHMRNLYRKLQIYSRQEAIELVEGFGRAEGAGTLSYARGFAAPAKNGMFAFYFAVGQYTAARVSHRPR